MRVNRNHQLHTHLKTCSFVRGSYTMPQCHARLVRKSHALSTLPLGTWTLGFETPGVNRTSSLILLCQTGFHIRTCATPCSRVLPRDWEKRFSRHSPRVHEGRVAPRHVGRRVVTRGGDARHVNLPTSNVTWKRMVMIMVAQNSGHNVH